MTDWTKPQEVNGLDVAFGARAVNELMPHEAEIPDEFRNPNSRNKWATLQADWFFYGLKDAKWTPKPGVDATTAVRHLAAIQASWEPRHEHKVAAVSYLASLWFENVTYSRAREAAR